MEVFRKEKVLVASLTWRIPKGTLSLNLETITKSQSLLLARLLEIRRIMPRNPQGLLGTSQESPRQVCK